MKYIRVLCGVLLSCAVITAYGDNAHGINKTPTLLITEGWVSDTIAPGLIYHNFQEKYDAVTGANQIVNVLELDIDNPNYELKLSCIPGGSACSDAVKAADAIAGINGGYEREAIYTRSNGEVFNTVTLPPGHLRYWKHEGAVRWSSLEDIDVVFPGKDGADALDAYNADTVGNIISSAPMLIDNFNPCGLNFVGNYTYEELKSFEYEDYRRHQGVRHPRTAVAITSDRDLLLITVDGRWPGRGEGMNAKELTEFLVKYFNPQAALNMDGGGSTTMVVKGHGDYGTNVVNYPTDNKVYDHTGERKVSTHFVVTKKK